MPPREGREPERDMSAIMQLFARERYSFASTARFAHGGKPERARLCRATGGRVASGGPLFEKSGAKAFKTGCYSAADVIFSLPFQLSKGKRVAIVHCSPLVGCRGSSPCRRHSSFSSSASASAASPSNGVTIAVLTIIAPSFRRITITPAAMREYTGMSATGVRMIVP